MGLGGAGSAGQCQGEVGFMAVKLHMLGFRVGRLEADLQQAREIEAQPFKVGTRFMSCAVN